MHGCSTRALAPISQPVESQPAAQKSARYNAKPGAAVPRPAAHVVKRGDTLYGIAWRYGLDYRQVARWNGINPPYVIYVGQALRLRPSRRAFAKASARPLSDSYRRARPKQVQAPQPSVQKPSVRPVKLPSRRPDNNQNQPKPQPHVQENIQWLWPTDGTLTGAYSDADASRKGLDIVGRLGQPIRTAAAGEVVYSGSGLNAYGQLVIVKHNKTYLSAYGHNRKLLVKEGDRVEMGQRIAEMGQGRESRAMLHFEIRKNGKPVDPLAYLPKRSPTKP